MRLVWVADDNYLDGTVVSIHSAIAAASRRDQIEIVLVLRDVPPGRRLAFERWGEKRWPKVTFRVVNFVAEIPFSVSAHISHASYIRLYLPDLLPDVDRVVYLDCDTLILGDLWELWQTDLDDAPAAGAADYGLPSLSTPGVPAIHNERGFNPGLPYINAGVILLDMAVWRRDSLHKRCAQALIDHREEFEYHDQDALNYVLAGHWKILPERWNYVPSLSRGNGLPWLARKLAQLMWVGPYRGLRDAAVVHFAGATKPWSASRIDPGVLAFQKLQNSCGWRCTG